MKSGWVYIMTNAPYGTLYIGVTADIASRVWQHKNGVGSKFCKQYGLDRLVHAEHAPTIVEAIAREKAMKAWKRAWKSSRTVAPGITAPELSRSWPTSVAVVTCPSTDQADMRSPDAKSRTSR